MVHGSPVTKQRKGGWQPTTRIPWADVKDALFLVSRCHLNVSFDIMPPSGSDSERKRFIQQRVAHLMEAIKRRRGQNPIGFYAYEKGGPNGRDLHGHLMLRVEHADFDIVERVADGIIIDATFLATPAAREAKASYITKQRQVLAPDFEARIKHRYEANPAPVPGKRISFTKAAQAVLLERRAERARLKAARLSSERIAA